MSSHSEGICRYKLHCKSGGCLGVQGVIAFPCSYLLSVPRWESTKKLHLYLILTYYPECT